MGKRKDKKKREKEGKEKEKAEREGKEKGHGKWKVTGR